MGNAQIQQCAYLQFDNVLIKQSLSIVVSLQLHQKSPSLKPRAGSTAAEQAVRSIHFFVPGKRHMRPSKKSMATDSALQVVCATCTTSKIPLHLHLPIRPGPYKLIRPLPSWCQPWYPSFPWAWSWKPGWKHTFKSILGLALAKIHKIDVNILIEYAPSHNASKQKLAICSMPTP